MAGADWSSCPSTASFSLGDLSSVDLTATIWSHAGLPRIMGLAIAWAGILAALVVAGRELFAPVARNRPAPTPILSR